jgi:DNA processing protein
MGLDQGKNIYAVPGRITDKLSSGCNNLIKMGAKVVTAPQDILEDFKGSSQSIQLGLTSILIDKEQIIYEILSLSPKHIEELMELTGFDIGNLTQHLLSLELKDMIHQPMKNYYIRNIYNSGL